MIDGVAKDYFRILHALNGMNENQVKQFRECIRCLFNSLNGGNSYIFKGILLHILGDTYGHLTLKPIYKKDPWWPYQTDPKILREYALHPDQRPGRIIGYEDGPTGSGAYNSVLGHTFDGTRPDWISTRPALAMEHISDVYYLVGGDGGKGDKALLGAISNTITTVANGKMDEKSSYNEFLRLYQSDPTKKGYDIPNLKEYNPDKDGTVYQPLNGDSMGVKEVKEYEMKQLIDLLKFNCPELKGVL